MKLLIIGSSGQLGSDFYIYAKRNGYSVDALDFPQVDIRIYDDLKKKIHQSSPDVILNCAAFTAVDACETEIKSAYDLNKTGPENIARCAQYVGATLVHFSTDYVFSGNKERPYVEEDQPDPLTVYGKSKLAGEIAVRRTWDKSIVVRIAWLYGSNGTNFVKSIRSKAKEMSLRGDEMKVVSDQVGTPTWTLDVVKQVILLLSKKECGVFHCTSQGMCTWYDFACQIIEAASLPVRLRPCETSEFPRPARRPQFSVLENKRLKSLDIDIMPEWTQSFKKYVEYEKSGICV
ncbi:dTDP-4-dehydrorhamnose reductase [Chitinispirillales bacterium ANBcel5]|uniref:dTDP-4-dehydrorhamnose reductase n=1 Tax=Cellulosispirillum alkaliphilum TaxID=3039283 RepID=UPI002A5725A5|nr:dTDP-4-dehydrorhamnose reductase [Chitinispirillales bacterium ANBcel5]